MTDIIYRKICLLYEDYMAREYNINSKHLLEWLRLFKPEYIDLYAEYIKKFDDDLNWRK